MTTAGNPQSPLVDSPAPEYKLVELESPFVLVSLVRQITQRLREPKLTVPEKYYRGEAALPVVEMRSWYRDLPDLVTALAEKSSDPIDTFNRAQEKWRAMVTAIVAFAGAPRRAPPPTGTPRQLVSQRSPPLVGNARNLSPKPPVPPKGAGPPLKPAEMATNLPWGEPKSLPGPP